jgi:hypothetical protein
VEVSDRVPQGGVMTFGKGQLKLGMSFNSRRIRLGVTHSGTPSSYIAPVKDPVPERKPKKQKRR